jgi:pimeloyl-ACP methyl ester carboxylesterase
MVLGLLEKRLTFKPTRVEHNGLKGFAHERVRFGHEFGLDLDGAFSDQGSNSVVLFLHGNRHNISRFREHYDLFSKLAQSFFTFDYPGYGTSAGAPSESAVYASARAAYDFLISTKGFAPHQMIVYGCSMGGAVAVDLSTTHSIAGLITEATFTNSREMAKHLYPYLPLWPFLPIRFRNDEKIRKVRSPVLMIHGEKDPVVPVSMATQLLNATQGNGRLIVVEEADHISCLTHGEAQLKNVIQEFINAVSA